ncbi:MAG: ketopantoate reductase family protein [Flavonifractor plautii]
MRYLVFGAGGTGGSLAAFLAQGGKDVSLIARGAHLEAIRRNGLVLESRHGTFCHSRWRRKMRALLLPS